MHGTPNSFRKICGTFLLIILCIKDVNLIIIYSTSKLRKRGSDGEYLDWLNVICKACFWLLWTFFNLVL